MTSHTFVLAFGAIGVVLTVASGLMRRMMPLRIIALTAVCAFGIRSTISHDYMDLALQVSLFFVNGYRLWDLKHLLNSLKTASAETPLQDWLLPHMTKKVFKKGVTIFSKGDDAHYMIYIRRGTVRIVEPNKTLSEGALIGEIGLFTTHRKRTATIVCETKCICYTMTDEAIYLLYFQNPALGFFLIRLIVQRLLQDLESRPAVAEA
jgi:CRP/FNR family transcriptional regulator, cyclic AMP receptor protein